MCKTLDFREMSSFRKMSEIADFRGKTYFREIFDFRDVSEISDFRESFGNFRKFVKTWMFVKLQTFVKFRIFGFS